MFHLWNDTKISHILSQMTKQDLSKEILPDVSLYQNNRSKFLSHLFNNILQHGHCYAQRMLCLRPQSLNTLRITTCCSLNASTSFRARSQIPVYGLTRRGLGGRSASPGAGYCWQNLEIKYIPCVGTHLWITMAAKSALSYAKSTGVNRNN